MPTITIVYNKRLRRYTPINRHNFDSGNVYNQVRFERLLLTTRGFAVKLSWHSHLINIDVATVMISYCMQQGENMPETITCVDLFQTSYTRF